MPSEAIRGEEHVCTNRQLGQLLTPMKTIRSNCLACCCGSAKEVALCPVTSCPAWPLRFGTRKRAQAIIEQERALSPEAGAHWAEKLPDYTSQSYYTKPSDRAEPFEPGQAPRRAVKDRDAGVLERVSPERPG